MSNIDVNNSLVVLDHSTHRINQGHVFRVYDSQTITTGSTLTYGISTGAKSLQVFPMGLTSSADKLTVIFYKDSTWTAGTGTALTANNFNHILNYPSTAELRRGVTVTAAGTEFSSDYLPGSTGVGQTRSGAQASGMLKYIIKPNSKLVFVFTNGSSGSNIATWSLIWDEV